MILNFKFFRSTEIQSPRNKPKPKEVTFGGFEERHKVEGRPKQSINQPAR